MKFKELDSILITIVPKLRKVLYLQEKFQIFLRSEGSEFDVCQSSRLIWSRVTLNRGLFPTNGSQLRFNVPVNSSRQ